jgi:putative ABC transport system permease protein
MKSEGSHLWVLLLDKTEHTNSVLPSIRGLANVPASAPTNVKLEIVPWYDLADFYSKTANLFSRQVLVVQVIIAVIVGLSILNSMTMSVMERTGDIGTAMAIGTRQSRVLLQFVAEGAAIGLLGALVGVAIAYPLGYIISAIGIPMPPPPGQSWGYLGQIRITPDMAAATLGLVFATALAASLFPAWKASRLNVVDALRKSR